jgi:DNA polymerase-3 subunit epsilon
MTDKQPLTLAPGERIGKNGRPYNYENWKKEKIEKGKWLTEEEWLEKVKNKKKDLGQKESRKRKSEQLCKQENKVLKLENDIIGRIIIFDTETTGLGKTDEIVEISLIETIEGIKTGRHLHFFINPYAQITKKAQEIHRLTKEKLSSHPRFEKIAYKIAAFIGPSMLMAHNAKFDMGMLNRGFEKAGLDPYPLERFICTAKMARFLFPGVKNTQDALCSRFGIDNFNRVTTGIHSAIEDTIQLYHIYKNMNDILEKKNICPKSFCLG